MVKQAVVIKENDSVATATLDLKKGTKISMFIGEKELDVVVKDDIPFGHKLAIKDIAIGEHVLKYSESIGKATKDIKIGDHVHVHNVESARGRGDL
ncbi:altronate hydrolase UxaA [Clostridium aceticum]|uniref:Altronate hydrolase UxaA n=1 Tax=Clostridium aceticum TaxID=84022 RepID=A0A0D8I7R3_9CLOT|nr:UxaA family hydrolase [Clostridium aceticum]AKL97268.1 altronate hydrolase UxaA [Clostridium aceticum]KJF26293.1 D-galactarate dehydratase [Clostridium aceticum]